MTWLRDTWDEVRVWFWPPRDSFNESKHPRLARAWWIARTLVVVVMVVLWLCAANAMEDYP